MIQSMKQHRLLKMLIMCVLVIGASTCLDNLPYRGGLDILDTASQAEIDSVIARAGETFLVAKAINSILSVAKSSQLSFSIVAGGSVTPGAWLDPLDQLIDDFSDWLLEGLAAVSIIKISLLAIHQIGMIGFTMLIVPILVVVSFYKNKNLEENSRYIKMCQVLIAGVVFVRVGIPVAFIVMAPLSDATLKQPYDTAYQTLEKYDINIDDPFSQKAVKSIEGAAHAIFTNSGEFFRSLGTITSILFIQMLIFPVLMVLLCWRLCLQLLTQL